MTFAGVSVISAGKLMGSYVTPPIDAGAASGYHLLVVEGHSRTRNLPQNLPLTSRYFIVGGDRWCIFYYPDGSRPDATGFLSLRLFHDHSYAFTGKTTVKAQFEFSFVDETEKHDAARISASTRVFKFDCFSTEGYDRFVQRNELEKSKHLKDDSFTIRCDVLVLDSVCSTAPIIEVPPSQMHRNLTDLLLAGEGTDVAFQVGDETICAHRCILAARSAVFKASLFGPMKEGSTSTVVQIYDMDATVFKAMLGFIYGDTLPAPALAPVPAEGEEDEKGIVLLQHLLVAADRYDLPRLRAMCEKRLCEDIGVGTVTALLGLAEQHNCDGLKAACYEFLRCPANLKAVVATDGFDHLCRSCPPVMKDLILGMLQAHK